MPLPFTKVAEPFWDDEPVYIVGGGDSLRGFDFTRLNGLGRIVGVNRSAWLCGASVLVSLDQHFVRMCRAEIAQFIQDGGEAFLVMPPNEGMDPIEGATYILRDRASDLSEDPKRIYGVNSGYAAIGLAYLKRARSIALLGFDMQYNGNVTHWHGGYEWHGKQSHRMYDKWANGFERPAAQLEAAGTQVINFVGNPKSKLTCFRTSSLNDL